MKNRKDFLKSVSESIGHPLIEICGQRRLLIENHQGIVVYHENEVAIKVCFGIVQVIGEGLRLCRMSKEQLVITGRIAGVAFERGE